jgi:hypothetical protein
MRPGKLWKRSRVGLGARKKDKGSLARDGVSFGVVDARGNQDM